MLFYCYAEKKRETESFRITPRTQRSYYKEQGNISHSQIYHLSYFHNPFSTHQISHYTANSSIRLVLFGIVCAMFNILGVIFTTLNALIPGLYTIKALDQRIEFRPSSYQVLLNYWVYYILLNFIASTFFNDLGLVHLCGHIIKCWLFYGGKNNSNIALVNHVLFKCYEQRVKQGEVMILHVLSRVAPQFSDLNHLVHNFGLKYEEPLQDDVSIDGEAIMEQVWNVLGICQSVIVAAAASHSSSEGVGNYNGGTPPKKLRKLRNVKSFTSLTSRLNSHSNLQNIKQERQSSLGYLNKFFTSSSQRPISPGVEIVQSMHRNVSSPAAPTVGHHSSGGNGAIKSKRRTKSGSEYDLGVPFVRLSQQQVQNHRDDEQQYLYQQQQQQLRLNTNSTRERNQIIIGSKGQLFTQNLRQHHHPQERVQQPQFYVGNKQVFGKTQGGEYTYAPRSDGVNHNDGSRVSSRRVRNVQDVTGHHVGATGGSAQVCGPGAFDELPAAPTPSMVIE